MRIMLYLVLLAGIVLGPGVYIYTTFVAGPSPRTEKVRGVDSRKGGYTWFTPVTISLSPSMNPIAFDLKPRWDAPVLPGVTKETDTPWTG